MSNSDALRAKAAECRKAGDLAWDYAPEGDDYVADIIAQRLSSTLYECTAALVDAIDRGGARRAEIDEIREEMDFRKEASQ